MLLESITLTNFRQYKGTQTIQFSTDEEQNVTVITGENTCGKTTLVQSFIWCLYGHTEFKDKNILNAEVLDELKESAPGASKYASVVVKLSHDNKNYIIERKEVSKLKDYKKIEIERPTYFKIYIVDSLGNTLPLEAEDYYSTINDILPDNLSDYFFFWGERIEKLSDKKEISSAVKQFLGLDTMDSAIRHLKLAVNRLAKEITPSNGTEEIERYQKQIKKLEGELEGIKTDIDSKERNIQHYKEKAAELYDELTTSENKALKDKQTDYRRKQMDLGEDKAELEKAKTLFSRHFNDAKNYVYFYAEALEKNAVELLKNNPEPVIGWKYIDLNAINEILKRGKCICGNEFCEGDAAHQYLMDQRKLVAPHVVGGVINSFIEEAERRDTFNDRYYELMHDDYKTINELADEILDLEFDIANLQRYLNGKQDIKEKEKRYKDAQQKVNVANGELGSLKEQKNTHEKDIDKLENAIERLARQNDKYIKQSKQLSYARQVLDVFNKDYEDNEKKLRQKLQDYVNQNFDEVYSGDRRIAIDSNYNATALNKVGENWITSETSPGLETVKNFAFISGLIQCAKEKIVGADGTEKTANVNSYPLVLDAPFSQADEVHVPAISKLIARNAEQIILVIMKKDWNYAEKVLSPMVGKRYNLEKQTETFTNVKEVSVND